MIKLHKWRSIWPLFNATYKIINREINNFDTCKILKNRLKKIKNSSGNATLNYLFFEIPSPKNAIEKTNEINNRKI